MINILQNQEFVNLDEYFNDEKIIDGKIYKITNLITGRIYIGQTILSVTERWKGHIYDSKKSKRYLYRSMRKYGIENFKIEQIDSATTYSELNQKEYDWIIKENCLAPNGYNMINGGKRPGYSEFIRDVFRKNMQGGKWYHDPITQEEFYIRKGANINEELVIGRNDNHLKRNKKYKTGFKHSLETKEKMILSHQKEDKEYLIKIRRERSKMCKWYHDPITQEEFFILPSEKTDNLINGRNIKHKEIFSERMRDYHHTDLTKQKISKFFKELIYFYNPETKQQIRLHKNDEIPEGFIKGKLPVKRKWFYNPETMEEFLLNIDEPLQPKLIPGRSPITFE